MAERVTYANPSDPTPGMPSLRTLGT